MIKPQYPITASDGNCPIALEDGITPSHGVKRPLGFLYGMADKIGPFSINVSPFSSPFPYLWFETLYKKSHKINIKRNKDFSTR
jgi:hypothetical protein